MKKNGKRLLSMLLALSMVFGQLVFPVSAEETETVEPAETPAPVVTLPPVEDEIVVSLGDYQITMEDVYNVVPLKTDGVEVDMENPIIITIEEELNNMLVLNAEGEPVPLTEEEKQKVLVLFDQYLQNWKDHADLLGVQVPFFLSYNDEQDGLGVLGEMLALANLDVATVRAGYMTVDDLLGMIMNFYYGDALGLQFYGEAIATAREEVIAAINASGAKTEAQKLLVINDWMAHNMTFDMPYIMNTDKEEGEEPMVAENPQEHEHYQDVYNTILPVYEDSITETFQNQIRDGLEAEVKAQVYQAAIKNTVQQILTQQVLLAAAADEEIVAYVEQSVYTEKYEEELKALEGSDIYQDAYNEAYNNVLSGYCATGEHVFQETWSWTTAENEWGYSAATLTLKCSECPFTVEAQEAELKEKVTYEATCTEGAGRNLVATVTYEGKTYTAVKELDAGAPLGHNMTKTEAKAATCTEAGNPEYYVCDRCDKYFADEKGGTELTAEQIVIAATNHANKEKVEGKAATCTETGLTEGEYCPDCKTTLVEQEEINALGHDMEYVEAEESTCTVEGTIAYYTCKTCKKNFSDEEGKNELTTEEQLVMEKKAHTEAGIDPVEATCTTNGSKNGIKCSVCNTVIKEPETIEATGHTGGTATCAAQAICVVCTQPYGDKLPHEFDEAVWSGDDEDHWHQCKNCDATSEPEEHKIADGWENNETNHWHLCAICGKHLDEAAHAPSDGANGANIVCTVCNVLIEEHKHTAVKQDKVDATCTETGMKEYYLCACGMKFEDENAQTQITDDNTLVIEKLDHDFTGTGEVIKEATCTETGTESIKCSRCEATTTEEIPMTDHNYGDFEVTTKAGCLTAGEKTRECAKCGKKDTQVIDATGHDLEKDGETPATCVTPTIETYKCKNCNHEETKEVGEALGHIDETEPNDVCDRCNQAMPNTETGGEGTGDETGDNTDTETEENKPETPGEATPEEEAVAAGKAAGEAAIKAEAEKRAQAAVDALTDEEIQEMAMALLQSDEETMAELNAEAVEQTELYMTQNAEAIAADPAGFMAGQEMFLYPYTDDNGNTMTNADGSTVTIADYINMQADGAWADIEANGMAIDESGTKYSVDQIVTMYMDQPMDDLGGMTPNQAIPVYADQAAVGLTEGILDYWQGSHIGAFGRGTAVCLGYTKAFTYLVQYIHPEIYGKNGANTDMSVSTNWKTPEELYYTNGQLSTSANYIVDDVRITFDASVTMYGETQDNFNSDHFWNAVKVDGQWFYIDPCYTDVFTEVMMRDRVETDGSMNHMYFLFSHNSTTELYDGYYSEIKSLYENLANSTIYEDSWISRIKSNTYFHEGYAYYLYDSTDLITIMEEVNNNNNADTSDMEDKELKLVAHNLSKTDSGNNAEDFEVLIAFNDLDAEESVATYLNAEGEMVESELLTKLYAQHEQDADIYPSLAVTMGMYGTKLYFNLSNVVLAYDLETCEVEIVKEYNTVNGTRDKTNPFGGMAFTVSDDGELAADNHPIAALTVKNGSSDLTVSIATNYAFISGKDPHNSEDQSSYGYEFEESNYNPDYNSYTNEQIDEGGEDYEQYEYMKEINDNDEFMWTANFVDTLNLACSHTYEEVSIPAYCGRNAYTENRCTTCGISEPGTRVEVEDSALSQHHYVLFAETYYTEDDRGNWNEGECYVCTVCGFHIEEPTEPTENQYQDYDEQMEKYEKELAIYEEAVEIAGHTYVPTDATWADDYSNVKFSKLECSSVCPERKNYVDCLLEDSTISFSLRQTITNSDISILSTEGICTEGLTVTYGASGTFTSNRKTYPYTVTTVEQREPTDCDLTTGICPVCGNSNVKRVAGSTRVETAIEAANVMKAEMGVEKFSNIIVASGLNFADALAGSYLAVKKEAPILLYLDGNTANLTYIQENLAEDGTIYVLGGNAAVKETFDTSLTDAGIAADRIVRLAGATRFETNLLILEEAGVPAGEEILVATGLNFADCLSASAVGKPILMVNSTNNVLTDAQKTFLSSHADSQVAIIGGTSAVSETLEAAVAELVEPEIIRLAGSGREDTSVKVAERYFTEPTFAVVAYSLNYPDGLCGGPLAFLKGAPLLLTRAGQEAVVADYIEANAIDGGYIMGGDDVVSDESARAVFGITSDLPIPNA